MQTVRFSKKQDGSVIDIDDVVENRAKIYCCNKDDYLKFLIHKNNSYYWHYLGMGSDASIEFKTFSEAMNCFKYGEDFEVLIFDSQCEVLEYAKKM